MNESTKSDEKPGDGGSDPNDNRHATDEVMDDAKSGVSAQSMEECMGKSLESLSTAFTSSAKRWETIVYPSLFAFILLASYGFYLIYNLTNDVGKVANYMESIASNMDDVSVNMNAVSHNMVIMTQTVDSQSAAMNEMTLHMRHMSVSMGQMRYDMSVMNNSVSRPMQFMNSFMPW